MQIGNISYAIWGVPLGNMGKRKEINGKRKKLEERWMLG
jgi:hypothetical protein